MSLAMNEITLKSLRMKKWEFRNLVDDCRQDLWRYRQKYDESERVEDFVPEWLCCIGWLLRGEHVWLNMADHEILKGHILDVMLNRERRPMDFLVQDEEASQ
jgi:hypothetical protein